MQAAARGFEAALPPAAASNGRPPEPVIVFTEYRDTLLQLAATLPPSLQLHGGLTASERAAVQARFNDSRRPAAGDRRGGRGAESAAALPDRRELRAALESGAAGTAHRPGRSDRPGARRARDHARRARHGGGPGHRQPGATARARRRDAGRAGSPRRVPHRCPDRAAGHRGAGAGGRRPAVRAAGSRSSVAAAGRRRGARRAADRLRPSCARARRVPPVGAIAPAPSDILREHVCARRRAWRPDSSSRCAARRGPKRATSIASRVVAGSRRMRRRPAGVAAAARSMAAEAIACASGRASMRFPRLRTGSPGVEPSRAIDRPAHARARARLHDRPRRRRRSSRDCSTGGALRAAEDCSEAERAIPAEHERRLAALERARRPALIFHSDARADRVALKGISGSLASVDLLEALGERLESRRAACGSVLGRGAPAGWVRRARRARSRTSSCFRWRASWASTPR